MNGCNEKSRRNRDGGMRRESRKLVSGGPAKERKCVFVCVREGGGGGGVRGTMVQPGCSDPGKPKLLPGPFSICTI